MRISAWMALLASGSGLLGCNLNLKFESNRGEVLARNELAELMSEIARVVVSAELGGALGLQDSGLPFNAAAARSACVPDSTGSARRNAMGIPTDLTYSWVSARCRTGNPGTSRTFGGTTRIQDLGGRFSLRLTHDNIEATMETPTLRARYTASGTVEIRVEDGATATIVQRMTDKAETITPSTSGVVTKVRDLTLGLVDTLGLPITGARRRPMSLSVRGSYIAISEGARRDSTHLVLSTLTPLQADPTCRTGYRAGEVRAIVSGVADDDLIVRYNCQ